VVGLTVYKPIIFQCTVVLQEAAAGRIAVNVVGFSMGNAWIAPEEQIMSYGPMLYQLVNKTAQM